LGLAAAVAASVLSFVAPVAARTAEDALPEAPGKDVVLAVCTMCHEAAQFAYARFSPEGWDNEIAKMQSAGAIMTPDQQLAISAYLSKYLAKAPPPDAPAKEPSPR
jgi:competence protein ComEA